MIKGDRIYVKRGLYAGEYGTFLSSELVFKDGRYQDICFVKLDRHRFTEVMLSRFDVAFISRPASNICTDEEVRAEIIKDIKALAERALKEVGA